LKFAIELQAVYLRGTTYLRTPSLGIIPVVTLFVVCAGAVNTPTNADAAQAQTLVFERLRSPAGVVLNARLIHVSQCSIAMRSAY